MKNHVFIAEEVLEEKRQIIPWSYQYIFRVAYVKPEYGAPSKKRDF